MKSEHRAAPTNCQADILICGFCTGGTSSLASANAVVTDDHQLWEETLAFIQNEPRWRSFLGRRCCHAALKVTYYLHFQPLLSQKEKIMSVLLDEGSGLVVARLTYRMQRAVTQMCCVFMRVYYIKVDRWWIRPWLEPVRVFIEQVGRRPTKIKK